MLLSSPYALALEEVLIDEPRYDEYAPPNVQLHRFFRENGWRVPQSNTNNPYTYAHHTDGLTMFEYLSLDHERLTNFNHAMQAQSSQTTTSFGMYPFREELTKMETSDEDVLVVDVGGGLGQASRAIRRILEGVSGKVVLQDRPEVLKDFDEGVEGIETVGMDLYKPNPTKGTYYSPHFMP